jgi:hypothetical protein
VGDAGHAARHELEPDREVHYNRGRVTSAVGSTNSDMTGNWKITYTAAPCSR